MLIKRRTASLLILMAPYYLIKTGWTQLGSWQAVEGLIQLKNKNEIKGEQIICYVQCIQGFPE